MMPRPNLREQIIDAAVATLHRQGFNGSSVQDITEAAHAPKGSFYNHFESKEDLAIAALDRYWERVEASLTLLDGNDIPPRERIARYFSRLNDAARKGGFRTGCLIGNLTAEMAAQESEGEGPASHSACALDRSDRILRQASAGRSLLEARYRPRGRCRVPA